MDPVSAAVPGGFVLKYRIPKKPEIILKMPKIKAVPIFDGDETCTIPAEDSVRKITEVKDALQWDNATTAFHFKACLSGKALEWLLSKEFRGINTDDWEAVLKPLFMKEFVKGVSTLADIPQFRLDPSEISVQKMPEHNLAESWSHNKWKTIGCGGSVIFVLTFSIVIIFNSVHIINEGMVGIYFVHGALQDQITYPGVHWSLPFVTRMEEITIRPRTDTLDSFQTITRDGIQNVFVGAQVLSDVEDKMLLQLIKKFGMEFRKTLIYDRVKEEIRTFCANNTIDDVYNERFLDMVGIVKSNVEKSIERLGLSGIQILNLVILKPEIPPDIALNYMKVKVQWTEQLVAVQEQKTDKIKKETEMMKAILDAQRQKEVLQIDIEKNILQKEGDKKISQLENEIFKLKEQNIADVENYKKNREADANKNLFSPEYVKLSLANSLSNNTKFFFSGDQSPLGAVLARIMGET